MEDQNLWIQKNKKNNVPLHAATRKKIKAGYIDEFTNNLRTMASKLGDMKLLTLLVDDARCSELYNHNLCRSRSKRSYENLATAGEGQHQDFSRTRFIFGTHDVQDSKIIKNMLKLPKDANKVLIKSPCITITEQMFSKIRDACKFLISQAKSLFMGEISCLPECFVNKKDATPYHNAKAAIIPLITEGCVRPISDDVEGLIVDLSVIIRAQSAIIPKGKTFKDLSSRVLRNISDTATYRNAQQIDIVADLAA